MRGPVSRRERVVYPLVVLALAGLLYVLFTGLHSANTTRQALCTLRGGYDDDIAVRAKQVQPNRRFVRKHPHGALGFTQAQLRKSVRDNETALAVLRERRKALSILHC